MGGWGLGDVVFILLVCGLIYGILRLVNHPGSSPHDVEKGGEPPGHEGKEPTEKE